MHTSRLSGQAVRGRCAMRDGVGPGLAGSDREWLLWLLRCLGAWRKFVATKKERLRTAFYVLRLRPACRCSKEVFQGRFQGSRAALPGGVRAVSAPAGATCCGGRVAGDGDCHGTATGRAGWGWCEFASTIAGMQACGGRRGLLTGGLPPGVRACRRVAGDGDCERGDCRRRAGLGLCTIASMPAC